MMKEEEGDGWWPGRGSKGGAVRHIAAAIRFCDLGLGGLDKARNGVGQTEKGPANFCNLRFSAGAGEPQDSSGRTFPHFY